MQTAMSLTQVNVMGEDRPKELCLLALDGGGVRGLSSLQILRQLMLTIDPEHPPKPCDCFDMIGGTSTGGLIAIMLGRLKMSVDECIQKYTELADKVFRKKRLPVDPFHRPWKWRLQSRFDSDVLEQVIKDIITEKGLALQTSLKEDKDPSCKVFVCATSKEDRNAIRLFTSYKPEGPPSDLLNTTTIWEAGRATAAAISFFDPITIGSHGEQFVDGATGANNPIWKLWREADQFWGSSGALEENLKCLVSIGTGVPSLEPFGGTLKEVGKTLLAISTETKNTADEFLRHHTILHDQKRYFRFNVEKGLEKIGLEDSGARNFIAAATRSYLESELILKEIKNCGRILASRKELQPSSPTMVQQPQPQFQSKYSEFSEVEQACLQSLAFHGMDFRRNDIADPANHTCSWLPKHPKYRTWRDQQHGLLWIKGMPGAGKSTLMRYIAQRPMNQGSLALASFFFHGRGSELQKSPLGLFRSLLHQLVHQIPQLRQEFSSIFKTRLATEGEIGKKWDWTIRDLKDFFKDHITNMAKIHQLRIYVDALDECGEKTARDLVDFFDSIASSSPTTEAAIQICFSCRHYPLVALENGLEICVEDETKEDIKIYISEKLKKRIQGEDVVQELQHEIERKAQGSFQWASLVIYKVLDHYRTGEPQRRIMKSIKSSPPELNDLYKDILSKVDDRDRARSLHLLQWICFAKRPLSLTELRYALVINVDTPCESIRDLQDSEEYVDTDEAMGKKVAHLSRGLAEVKEQDGKHIAQFVHQSVSDYLLLAGLHILEQPSTTDVIGHAHFWLSRSCIIYMATKEIRRLDSKDAVSLQHQFPLLQYAVFTWTYHAEKVEEQSLPQPDLLAFFHGPSHDLFKLWLHVYQILDSYPIYYVREGASLLHIASALNLMSVVISLLKSADVEADSKDNGGRTPLSWAAMYGHEAVARLLVARSDVEADSKDNGGRTPLSRAAASGHEAVARLLVARSDVEADSKDNGGRTPLSWAAMYGHEAVARLLVARSDVEADSKDNGGRTPLSWAAMYGHEAVARLLVARSDVEADSKDNGGQTPLSWAAASGHEAVARLLVARSDVEADSKDNGGRTPLSRAAASELIPLPWLAERGREAVVRLLVARSDVEADSKDNGGRTPLSWAAASGQFPLPWLAEREHEAVVRLLVARSDVEADSKDNGGRTPLSWAADGGHEAVVRLLREV